MSGDRTGEATVVADQVIKKGHVVRLTNKGALRSQTGVVRWIGRDGPSGENVAVVRWDHNGALIMHTTKSLAISIITLSAEKQIVRERRGPSGCDGQGGTK